MLYYRYRPPTELCLKELLYNELYFCSAKESNDPFEGQSFFEFPADKEKWEKLLLFIKKKSKLFKDININATTKNIIKLCPIAFSELFSNKIKSKLISCIVTEVKSRYVVKRTYALELIEYMEKFYPEYMYFVSFSKTNNEPLLWSHYAGKHEGFCLIFKSINGILSQDQTKLKKQINRKTNKGFASLMSQAIQKSFPFKDINYVNEVELLDAFLRFPESVAGGKITKEQEIKLAKEYDKHYIQKHKTWNYENESRLIFNSAEPWAFGEQIILSPLERLIHYEPTQLVGIIYGSRMKDEFKSRIREIIKQRIDQIAIGVEYSRVMFDFVIFESKLSNDSRSLQIKPLEIIGLDSNGIKSSDTKFEEKYKKWQDGHGVHSENGRFSRVQIP